MRLKWLLLIIVVVGVAAYRSVVFVDEAEMVIITQFGDPIAELKEAGPRLKWPYQSAIRIDKRLQIYDPRPSEFLAAEKKNVDLDVFVCWRVEEPLRFLQTVSDFPSAEARLHDIVWSELAAEIGSHPRESLVSIDPQQHKLDEHQQAVANRCRERAGPAYGIRIVDVRLKRIGLPTQVRESVFGRMRTERESIARQYRAEGDKEAQKIRALADKGRTVTLAEAYAEAEETRGEAEAKATEIYSQAHRKDPAFYELVRTLESYKKFLDEKTTILLSADADVLKYLTGSGADAAAAAKESSGK
jgi:membrane protease subunit HflC